MLPFFGDDEFPFLDTYRERSNDEDESDNEGSQTSSSSSVSENNDEQEFVYTSCATSFDLPQTPVAHGGTPVGGQEDSDDDDKEDEPSPWRGSKAEKRQEDSSEDDEDEDKEGEWDELLASFFGELDEYDDERTSGEGGLIVMLILELILTFSLASQHQRRRMAMKKRFRRMMRHPHIPIPPIHRGRLTALLKCSCPWDVDCRFYDIICSLTTQQ